MSNSDSGSESDSESNSESEDISICNEIGQLINQCHQLHNYIDNSFETLHNIKYLINTHTNINVLYNGSILDFDELLENLHKEALENIKGGIKNYFGQKLLDTLNTINFYN